MIKTEHLSKRYAALTAVDDVTFQVNPGEVLGFLGPNGAGKTTTMRAVFGLTDLAAGTVQWRGRPVTTELRRGFGYMPEERGLYPDMALAEQISYLGRLHGMAASAAEAAAHAWLDDLGLGARAHDRVETLSHGNQQRAQLAAALVHDPELLVLDEPLAGLDPGGIDAVSEVLRGRARTGCCVLLSSHQLDLVEDLCESVVIIDHGRLLVSGRVDELATGGAQRLLVRVDGDADGAWAAHMPGVTVSSVEAGAVRLALAEGVDSQSVLAAAMAAGRVTEFGVVRRRLSEVFREAMT